MQTYPLGRISFFIAAVFCLVSSARAEILPLQPYRDGSQICSANNLAQLHLTEFGRFISVPVNYLNESVGTTQVYAWTLAPFDPSKSSVLFFEGGPGGSSHYDQKPSVLAPDYNVIFFDQRAIFCSRPSDKSLLTKPGYISSENTARDSDKIRKAFGIKNWSLYGHSYGTVPATIAAHFFPQTTTALVLEGTVFDGSVNLWTAPQRLKISQNIFDSLDSASQTKILDLSARSDVKSYWFSALVWQGLYQNLPLPLIRAELSRILSLDIPAIVATLKNYGDLGNIGDDTETATSPFALSEIACRELSATDERASFWYTFSGRVLKPFISLELPNLCKRANIENKSQTIYSSVSYPIRVPVTYFAGKLDGATDVHEAFEHYAKVAKGPAQLILAPQGGHRPTDGPFTDQQFISTIFQTALRGEKISREAFRLEAVKDPFQMLVRSKSFP